MRPDFEDEAGKRYQCLLVHRSKYLKRIRVLEMIKTRETFEQLELDCLRKQIIPDIGLQISAAMLCMAEAET